MALKLFSTCPAKIWMSFELNMDYEISYRMAVVAGIDKKMLFIN